MSAIRAAALARLRAMFDALHAERILAQIAPAIAALPPTGETAARDDIAGAHETALPIAHRRARGIYYTPAPVVDLLLADVDGHVERLVDPSCGGGAFFLGALRSRRVANPASIFGADTDRIAVEIARLSVFLESGCDSALVEPLTHHITCAESLTRDWSALEGTFDAVVGNPPFVDSEAMSRQSPALRAGIRARYATARGNWDLSVPFFELALRLARPGGTIALVVPRQILGSDYAAEMQRELLRNEIVSIRDLDAPDLFDGAGAPVALLTVRKRTPARAGRVRFESLDASLNPTRVAEPVQSQLHRFPPGHILAPLDREAGPLLTRFRSPLRLRDVAAVSDGATTAEAYLIRDALREATDADLDDASIVRLVNTGSIDPFVTRWGERPTVYLKRRLIRPLIDREALQRISPRRLAQADAPKVVVAGLCRRIEAVALPPGWLCAKSAVLVLTHEGVCPHALAALLNAPSTTALHRAVFAGRSLGRGALHIAPRQLEQLPLPDRGFLAPGGELSQLGRAANTDLDGALSACFDATPAGTIRAP